MARRRRRSRGRRRNPGMALAIPARELVPTALYAIGGGVVTRSVPQMLLKEKNEGPMGYAANAATALAVSWLAERFIGANAGKGALIGGAVALGGRLVEDFFGKKFVEFGQFGIGADPGYDLGAIDSASFPLPAGGQVYALPAPAAVPGNGNSKFAA